jgi:hypothetical protein
VGDHRRSMNNKMKQYIHNYYLIIIAFTLFGCASSKLPQKLSESEMQKIQSTELPYNIAVEEYQYPVYSDKLKTHLNNAKMFKIVEYTIVEYTNQTPPPTLIAKVEDRIYGTACFPLLTFITLGIVPTIVEENHGDSFSLSSPGNPNDKVMITFRYRSTSILGWAGLFLNLHPDWWLSPESSNRYSDSLSYAIAIKAENIKALVGKRKINIEPIGAGNLAPLDTRP